MLILHKIYERQVSIVQFNNKIFENVMSDLFFNGNKKIVTSVYPILKCKAYSPDTFQTHLVRPPKNFATH